MQTVKLEPKAVFDCFAEINKIPRPSKKEEKMIAFLQDYGKRLGLETKVDETGNVLIRKPATPGYEHLKTVIMQSHMDMVCEKRAGLNFDFEKDSIQTEIDGEWMRAKGTTLGADDGIGIAIEMAILADKTIEHGPLECVFTRDEEAGLGGAHGMKAGFMDGDYLLNLDSEDEGQIFVSCAGGANTEATFSFRPEPAPAGSYFFRISVSGLLGGHSGDEINKKRANANKLLIRLLDAFKDKYELRIADIQAGGLHNAIPRDGQALCCVPEQYKEQVRIDFNVLTSEMEQEYAVTEKTMHFEMETASPADKVMEKSVSDRMITALLSVPNGVLAMSQEIDDFVETSSNLASIHLKGNEVKITSSQRSNLMSKRLFASAMIRGVFALAGAKVETSAGYPGWKLDPSSPLLQITVDAYSRLFHKQPEVRAIHAGLECGLFSEKYPHIDMVSFGPTLRGVHSPDERLLIPTVKMVWDHLLEVLRNIPKK